MSPIRYLVQRSHDVWEQSNAVHIILFSVGTFLLLTFLGLRSLLKPIDKSPAPGGRKWKLPPGPRGWPIIGNLLLFTKGEVGAHEIASYGEMTTTHTGSKLWIVLNSNRLVHELYSRKGALTNERPPYPVVSDMISQAGRSVFLPAKLWAPRRRSMHQLLSGTAMTKYQLYQDQESLILLKSYLERPSEWYRHNYIYANNVVHRITFGERPTDNEMVRNVTLAQFKFLENAPPLNFWDNFPGLARLPKFMQWWRKKYEAMGKFTLDSYSAYFYPIRERIEAGGAPPSFAQNLLLGNDKFEGSVKDMMYTAMGVIEAGSDTTRLALSIYLLAAVTHPATIVKARMELDVLCGDAARLPGFEDEEKTPYVNALIKELLRWRRIFVWSPEHCLSQDLEFEGYHFPKGTGFVINHTSISENPEYYPEPQKFMPERWLDGNETDILGSSWQFGAGRRVCVGWKLSQRSLFINISRLIYCFDFKKREMFNDKSINHFTLDEPFPITPSIRSEKHARLIQQASKNVLT